MFYEPSTQVTYGNISEFRLAYRDTSFGDLNDESERNLSGLFTIIENRPEYDIELLDLNRTGVEEVDGLYYMTYSTTPKNLTVEQYSAIMLNRYTTALTDHLDNVAKQRRYDNRITCTIRAGFPGPFQAEGIAFATWMDNCNATAYQVWADVRNGLRPIPSSIEEFIALLPVIEWPPSVIPE